MEKDNSRIIILFTSSAIKSQRTSSFDNRVEGVLNEKVKRVVSGWVQREGSLRIIRDN